MTNESVKFLLVDDQDANLLALQATLKRDHLELLNARSGAEALELLLVNDVDLAFVDVQMPDMDGFELAELMRGTEHTRRIPIIFVTAGATNESRRFRGYELGAVDFLFKPIDPHILKSKADIFFDLARQRTELKLAAERAAVAQLAARAAFYDFRPGTGEMFFNPTIQPLLGYTPIEIRKRPGGWLGLVHPEDAARLRSLFDQVAPGQPARSAEYRVRHKLGHYVWLSDDARLIWRGQQELDRIVGMVADITNRKQSEAEAAERAVLTSLRAEIGVIRAAAQPMREGLVACCKSLTRHLNLVGARVWLRDLGGDGLRLDADSAWDGIPAPAELPHAAGDTEIIRVARSLQPRISEDLLSDTRLCIEDWEPREEMKGFAAYPLVVEGKLMGILALAFRGLATAPVQDDLRALAAQIGQYINRKQAEAALAQANAALEQHAGNLERAVAERTAELRESNDQLEAFVYSIAHDLRAPLRSISGCAELLKDQSGAPPGEDNRMLLERMQTAVHFMDKLLLDLLEFGRTARARLDLTKVEVKNAWDIAVFQNASAIKSASARVETIPPLLAVRAHEPTLGQALANLLGNALKFVEPGVQPSIRLRTEQRGESVRIWVEDNGIGISPAYIDRIFGVFERVHSTRFAGSGIGLSIVRKGIERMGGRVGVESEPGKGSRFWIELPKGE